jgi:hypothetical protein
MSGSLVPHRPELVPVKTYSETGCLATHHLAKCDELERDCPSQQRRPLHGHFQLCSHAEFVPAGHQNATAAQIQGQALSGESVSAHSVVADR